VANFKSELPLILVLTATIGIGYFVYDLLFSEPDHLEGTIIEKIFVPARTASGFGGPKGGNYGITVQHEDQWIAIVKMEAGDTLLVHCIAEHYKIKNVGDRIHFKKYEGKHFHIKYFAHNEEED
jgi:hypothetical protein